METGWPVDESCLPVLESGDTEDQALVANRDAAINLAVQVMWALSGRQFGIYGTLVRPCAERNRWQRHHITSYILAWESTGWVNWWCGCHGRCRYTGPGAVHLPGPAVAIVEVTINGVELDDDQYVLENNVLFRVGDRRSWPSQDLSRPLGQRGTWGVEYLRGTPVPAGAERLTGILAAEFYSAACGGKCRLPRSVSALTRNGLSFTRSPDAIFGAGRTGLTEVDQWLSAVNPNRLLQPPSVL